MAGKRSFYAEELPKTQAITRKDLEAFNQKLQIRPKLERVPDLCISTSNKIASPVSNRQSRTTKNLDPLYTIDHQTIMDFQIYGKLKYPGKTDIENIIAETRVRQGLAKGEQTIDNPSLVKEAMRPSIVTQHLRHEIKLREKRTKKERALEQKEQELQLAR